MADTNCKQVTTPVTDNTPLDCPVFVKDKCVILPTGSSFLLTDDDDSLEEYHIALEEKLILMNNTIATKENSLGNPAADGYVLTSTAAGVRSWSSVAGGSAHIIQDEGSDLPQRTYLDFTGTGVTVTDDSGGNTTTVTIASGGLNNIVEDVSPQLGGNLDLNGNVITGLEIGTDVQAYSTILQNTTASFTSTLLTKLNSVESNAKDDQLASEVPFTPYLTITSTNVQTAVQELKDEVDSISAGGISDGDKGDITVSGGGSTWTIDTSAVTTSKISDGSVTNSKLPANGVLFDRLEQLAQSTILGRASGAGTGDITALTPTQIRTIINVENGATGDQNATEVPIADAGGHYTTDNVEAALQQVGAVLADGDKGDISISSGVWTIDTNAVTGPKILDGAITTSKISNGVVDNSKLSTVATNTIKGRATAGTGNVEDLTAAQVRTLINVEDGAVSLPVDDTTSLVQDPVDGTKQMRIDVGAVGTGTVRVLTMPNANVDLGNMVTTNTTQTISGQKTLTSGLTVANGAIGGLMFPKVLNNTWSASTAAIWFDADGGMNFGIGGGTDIAKFAQTNTAKRTYTLPDQDMDLSTLVWSAAGFSGNLATTDDTLQEVFDKVDALSAGVSFADVGGMFSGNTETLITATYQAGDNTIDLVVDNDLANYNNANSNFITSDTTGLTGATQINNYVAITKAGYDAIVTPDANTVYDITDAPVYEYIPIYFGDKSTDLTVDTKLGLVESPIAGTITNYYAYVDTAPTGANIILDVNINGTTTMTTNKITIEATENSSRTAATQPGITTSTLAVGDILSVDVDQIGSTIAGSGFPHVIIEVNTNV